MMCSGQTCAVGVGHLLLVIINSRFQSPKTCQDFEVQEKEECEGQNA